MKKIHPLLDRQLKKIGIQESELSDQMLRLIEKVSVSYEQMDNERHQSQRIIEISCKENTDYKEKLENENKYIFSVMDYGVYIIDSHWHIIETNHTGKKILDSSLELIGDKRIDEIFKLYMDKNDTAVTLDMVQETISSKDILSTRRGIMLLPDGSKKHVAFSFHHLTSHKGIPFNGCLLFIKDISEGIRIENSLKLALNSAKNSNNGKSLFLANMSHEIRTPMNGIIGMLKILQGTDLNSSQMQHTEMCLTSANSLITIINDILDFSKLDAHKLSLNTKTLDLPKQLHSIEKIMNITAAEKDISLSFLLSQPIPQFIEADETRIRQIFMNLIGNAIKFTPENGEIIFKVNYKELPSPQLHCSIQDTGIGISQENQATIFESFRQAENQCTKQYGGTGLGLAICKELITLMGGEITVNSTLGEGSTFSFFINIKIATEVPETIETNESTRKHCIELSTAAIKAHVEVKPKILKKEETNKLPARILIVEDNPINQAVAYEMLRLCDLESDIANHGVEAIEMLLDNKYDLIFMDYHMPVLDGIETTKIIRDKEFERGIKKESPGYIPIIALTANAFDSDKAKCLEAGMDDFLAKPFQVEDLNTMLKKHMPDLPNTSAKE
tara:strand:+ start:1235 stop:3085 length:1851 start_codon:yes stop_codon:yes gene_type:complete